MINIITVTRYSEIFKSQLMPACIEFEQIDNIACHIPEQQLQQIVQAIEGSDVINGKPRAGFGIAGLISWDKISEGCKTAILIAYYTAIRKYSMVCLDGCGPNALGVCLRLLDSNRYVTGVISYYLGSDTPADNLAATINGKSYLAWGMAAMPIE